MRTIAGISAWLLFSITTGAAQTQALTAQQQADVGKIYLHNGRLADAQTNCDAALKSDPANTTAKQCLQQLGYVLARQDLDIAESDLASHNKAAAVTLASKWAWTSPDADQRARAWDILQRARSTSFADIWRTFTPDWLRQVLVTIVVLLIVFLLLCAARKVWRDWRDRRDARLTQKQFKKEPPELANTANEKLIATKWTMVPLNELPACANGATYIPTNLVLDAFGRLGDELKRPSWEPNILLLRPTPPADYEPAIIDDFLTDSAAQPIILAPKTEDLKFEWHLHDVQLDSAVQTLQLKTATSIDVGSVARFIASLFAWFNTGVPTISGVAQTDAKTVTVHLASRGGRRTSCTAVTASTEAAPGIDAMQLSAERAAFKFLFRMRYPQITTDEIDGFSALRQGITQFTEYAGTVPGVGDNAATRTSSLSKAAYNMNFFRTCIPVQCGRLGSATSEMETSLYITPEIRQAVLLAEGVAHALIGSEHDRVACLSRDTDRSGQGVIADVSGDAGVHGDKKPDSQPAKSEPDHQTLAKQENNAAIACFRQLQDWPGVKAQEPLPPASRATAQHERSALSQALRQQAVYNEAMVWRHMGRVKRAVQMLTDLLGERPGDTECAQTKKLAQEHPKAELPESIRIPAQAARLSAFAEYTRDDWSLFPDEKRPQRLIEKGEELVARLTALRGNAETHDERLADYMYIECLRALGHVKLMRVVTGLAKDLYQDGRPVKLANGESLREAAKAMVVSARESSLNSAVLSPGCRVYCDLAEGFLLTKDFEAAEGWARQATLRKNDDERAIYLICEICFLSNHADRAKRYAQMFKGATPTLPEFKALLETLKAT
jgi:tetratricopeptide (TPR) repeat protein